MCMTTCSDLQTSDSANCFSPFGSIANAKEGMCVLLNFLNTCQGKSYPNGLLLLAFFLHIPNPPQLKACLNKSSCVCFVILIFKDFRKPLAKKKNLLIGSPLLSQLRCDWV